MTWIGSNRNHKIDFLQPNPAEIDIYDIADGLAAAVRFRGLINAPLTVAQHCVIASKLCRKFPLEALLHDAHEAYTGDVPTPMKELIGDAWYEIEYRVQAAICERFEITPDMPPEVHEVDQILLATEKRDLQPRGPEWERPTAEPHSMKMNVWPAHQAKAAWLNRFKELTAMRSKLSA